MKGGEGVTTPFTKDEYVRRYVAEMVARSDVDEDFATASAETHWERFANHNNPEPEYDAAAEMSYWDE